VQWNPTLGEALVYAAGRYEGTTPCTLAISLAPGLSWTFRGVSRSGCDRSCARLFLFLGGSDGGSSSRRANPGGSKVHGGGICPTFGPLSRPNALPRPSLAHRRKSLNRLGAKAV
jgi:hypothetical protein